MRPAPAAAPARNGFGPEFYLFTYEVNRTP
jgi:hypothetical protein